MKITVIVSVAFTILAVTIAILISLSGLRTEPDAASPDSAELPAPPSLEDLLPPKHIYPRADNDVILRVLLGDEIVEMTMEQYLIGVVAAEMPALFEFHALKAQAVAARTNALHKVYVSPKSQHPDAHVCSNFRCCVAFNSDETLQTRWGDDYVQHMTTITNAVIATDGVFMAYNDEPILALFHASSAGMTETSGNVWVSDRPYLQSVFSPETPELVPGFISTVTVTRADFIETVQERYPNARFGEEPWITDIVRTESGRIFELTIGGVAIRGTSLRAMFGLRSTATDIEITGDNIVFTTTGHGHGVGMSQYGAHIMALNGKTYREILSAYYTGIVFVEP